ncbi:MAG TPA: hypothetical protein VGK89_00575 [Candidatus Eisenbacteria bacterium]|jgi:hypothetical protein
MSHHHLAERAIKLCAEVLGQEPKMEPVVTLRSVSVESWDAMISTLLLTFAVDLGAHWVYGGKEPYLVGQARRLLAAGGTREKAAPPKRSELAGSIFDGIEKELRQGTLRGSRVPAELAATMRDRLETLLSESMRSKDVAKAKATVITERLVALVEEIANERADQHANPNA